MTSNSSSSVAKKEKSTIKLKAHLWVIDFVVMTCLLSLLMIAPSLMKSDGFSSTESSDKAQIR